MKKKYIIKHLAIALAFLIGSVLMIIPPLITNGGAEIALCGLCSIMSLIMSISFITFAFNLDMYNDYLIEKKRENKRKEELKQSIKRKELELK